MTETLKYNEGLEFAPERNQLGTLQNSARSRYFRVLNGTLALANDAALTTAKLGGAVIGTTIGAVRTGVQTAVEYSQRKAA